MVCTIGLAGATLGMAVVARHRAQSAADLAALAAAGAVPSGAAAACAHARNITAAMRAQLVECQLAHLDVTVQVEVATTIGAARAGATAGPA